MLVRIVCPSVSGQSCRTVRKWYQRAPGLGLAGQNGGKHGLAKQGMQARLTVDGLGCEEVVRHGFEATGFVGGAVDY